MLNIHKTKDGDRLFISQMSDDHLKNTIVMLLRKITGYKNALEAKIAISPFKAALYEVDVESISKSAKTQITRQTSILYPYIAEAMLRKIDFSDELRETFGRVGREDYFEIVGADSDHLIEYYRESGED